MPQLIMLLLLAAGAVLLYRRFVRDAERLAQKTRLAERERQSGATGTLVKDPKTGEYRLRQDDEQ
nr:hypothetical protein [uncultured Gellertiella sp.]